MKLKRLQNNRGISLLEVLISMLLLAFGLLGLAPMLVVSVEGNVISQEHTEAANLAKQAVEFFEGQTSMPAMPFVNTETGLSGGEFTRTVRIADSSVDTLIPAGVYQIQVRVAWVDNQNVNRNTTYSTFILK